ncbi:hypothetical protein GGX14DRAFT_647011 [Mycena pura]|uniref:Uncharacterized protein n=1 Tax=Mycena pura TaxID=153505 RepID=A0AAD6VAW4_9AGAR|nr:hypothetical protein GGX14DRAFT_647011 [Mycena pura]
MESKQEIAQDVDMDAPQISTLRDDSPPLDPPPRRVKLLVKDTRGAAGQPSSSRKHALSDDDDEEEEDEEDELIDDDDDVVPLVPPSAPPSSAGDSPSKRKAPSKRKPRKTEKKLAEEERLSAEKNMQAGAAASLAPTMTWFEVAPSKAQQHAGQMGTLDVGPAPPLNIVSLDPDPSKPAPKKKVKATRKPPAVPRPRVKAGPKAKAVLLPVPPEDTTDVITGYTVTAASSPVTAHFEVNTPEPESLPSYANGPLGEDPLLNLQDTALPQYPLLAKPFSVQPPQKINSGFAPVLPLDRTGAKVRHWRVVNREIRGIAGGRWFARTWVGEKESPLAIALASGAGEKQSSSLALPKLPTMSISSPVPTKTAKVRAGKTSSLTASTVPSRSSSTVPSKMRTIMVAPKSDGDSDMVAAPGS